MSNKTPPLHQPPIYLIFSTLIIGFALLLGLIWFIGSHSTARLGEISDTARGISDDYKERLAQALALREEAVNVVAQAKLVRATQHYSIKIVPFRGELGEARISFEEALRKARATWETRVKQQRQRPESLAAWRFLNQEEIAAWEAFAAAAQEFLLQVNVAAYQKPTVPDTPKPLDLPANKSAPADAEDSKAAPLSTPSDPTAEERKRFDELRMRLNNAARQLINAIVASHSQSLTRVAEQQQAAAREVNFLMWGALTVGALVGLIALTFTQRRVASLRAAIRANQESHDFAQSVFDSQPNDILVFDQRGDRLAVNQAFLRDFQLTPAELLLQDYRGTLAHLPEVAALVSETLQQPDDNSVRHERKLVTPRPGRNGDGAARLFDIKVSPLTISNQTRGRVVVLEDITAAEAMREEVERSRTLSTVGQITAQVAHELYNPIGAIKLNIELLEIQAGHDEDIKHTAARLKRGVEHLSDIVLDLRYLTRPRDPERQPTDINRLLDEVVELASDRLERSRIIIARDFAGEAPQGDFDPQQLRKVFLNLLINAVEASPANSTVELHTRFIPKAELPSLEGFSAARGALQVSVTDHGAGMSEETKRRIFEAFYTTKRNGTGLGMMITQQIIKKHQGKIEIDSKEGRGTKVSVYLPV